MSYLKCSGCSEVFAFPASTDSAYTDLPEHWGRATANAALRVVPLPDAWDLIPVWCLRCNAPAWVEAIPTRQQLYDIAALRHLPVRKRPSGSYYHWPDADFQWLAQAWLQRTTPPRCLSCGDSYLLSLQHGQSALRHQDCWDSPIIFQHGFYIASFNSSGPDWSPQYLYDCHGAFCGVLWHVYIPLSVMPGEQCSLASVMLFAAPTTLHDFRPCLRTLQAQGHAAALAQLLDMPADTSGLHALLHGCLLWLGGDPRYPHASPLPDLATRFTAAQACWQRAAEAGSAVAAWNLAQLHSLPLPLADAALARQWHARAHALGLGLRLENGGMADDISAGGF